ncbi:AAA domain-containing protein [Bacillus sp. OK048]|nr:AAA domain-containing protein [Bacillus sp. OK048]
MIEKIRIKEVASYDSTGIEVNLGKINHIYGSIGTGKTTISELLRNSENQKFSSCNTELKQGRSDFDLFIITIRETSGFSEIHFHPSLFISEYSSKCPGSDIEYITEPNHGELA